MSGYRVHSIHDGIDQKFHSSSSNKLFFKFPTEILCEFGMKLRLDLILCFSTLFRLFFNTTAPSRYRDHHIPSCCYHCYYSPFLVEKPPRRHPQHGFPAPRQRVYQRRRPALCRALEAQYHASVSSSNHQTAGDDDPSPQHPFPAAAPVDDGPFAAVPLPGSDVVAGGHPQRQGSRDLRLLRQ